MGDGSGEEGRGGVDRGGVSFWAAEGMLEAAGRDAQVVQSAGGLEFVVAGYDALDRGFKGVFVGEGRGMSGGHGWGWGRSLGD